MQITPRDAIAGPRREPDLTDPDDLSYSLRISVWVRWFPVLIAWLLQFNYRPNFGDPVYIPTTLLGRADGRQPRGGPGRVGTWHKRSLRGSI